LHEPYERRFDGAPSLFKLPSKPESLAGSPGIACPSSGTRSLETASNNVIDDLHFMSSGDPRISLILFSLAAITRRVHSTRRGRTEAAVGPYALQDFNLFYTLRYGFRPSKIAFMATHMWKENSKGDWPSGLPAEQQRHYELADIRKWLEVFLKRLYAFSQFKRSALPNGPKVSAGGVIGWRAPSDGNAAAWLEHLDRNVPH
jgi:hypothetical protein